MYHLVGRGIVGQRNLPYPKYLNTSYFIFTLKQGQIMIPILLYSHSMSMVLLFLVLTNRKHGLGYGPLKSTHLGKGSFFWCYLTSIGRENFWLDLKFSTFPTFSWAQLRFNFSRSTCTVDPVQYSSLCTVCVLCLEKSLFSSLEEKPNWVWRKREFFKFFLLHFLTDFLFSCMIHFISSSPTWSTAVKKQEVCFPHFLYRVLFL